MEEIVIPNLDDDDDDETYALPPFARPSFGSSSTTSLPDTSEPPNNGFHRSHPSTESPLPRYGASSNTPPRPNLAQSSASYSVGIPTPSRPGPFKQSNGSSSSLITPGTSISSNPGLSARKGSFASLKNAFIKSAPNPVPPVPSLNSSAYPALKNPFSRFEAPSSPVHSRSPGPHGARKQSTASFKSAGGRSNASQGSASWKDENTRGVPPLPPIPTRGTPSRMGRMGSDAGSSVMFGSGMGRREGSLSGIADLGKTPGEEALKAVFKDFKEAANNTHPSLPATFESGVDPPFDTLLSSLAHCARRHPRHIIDLLTQWSKSHSEGINAAEVRAHLDRSLGLQMRVEDAAAILGARKSNAARYVLNRALIEVVRVVPREALGEDLGMALEGNAFAAYTNRVEKDEGGGNPHRKAVAQLQVELLGELSKTRFLTISDRFTRELGKYTTSQPTKESEFRTEHLLRGMRHLKLKVYPEEDLEVSSEFIEALAAFFSNTHGQSLKSCYAETLTHLLHSVVETATAEVNHPMWSKAIAVVLSRAVAMAQKPRYWSVAFPLVVVALGVSPREVFMQHWQGCMEAITARFKDRLVRPIAMNCFIRLLWIYLNRCSESSTSMRKRLDPITRMFFSSPMGLYPPELPLDPFITILHYIMVKQLDYGEDFVVDYLRDGTMRNDGAGEMAYPERATALVKATGYTLRTIEEERSSSWPVSSDFATFDLEGYTSSGDPLPADLAAKQDIIDFMKKCGPAFMSTLLACDRSVSLLLLSNDAVTLSAHASSTAMESSTEYLTRKHGDIHVSYSTRFDPALRLFASLLDVLPRCLPPDANIPQITNILCRGTFSADPIVCTSSGEAIRRVAGDAKHCMVLANTFTQFVFETRHVFRDTFVGSRLLESQFERVVRLWLDILQALVGHARVAAMQATNDGDAGNNPPVNRSTIEKAEGCALFLLCSTSLVLRKLAGQVLVAARDLEGEVRRPSAAFRYSRIIPEKASLTRVSQLYEATWEEGEVTSLRAVPWMTSSDRHRLDLIVAKDRTRLIARIAESDNPKDQALWCSALPIFISKVVDQLPNVGSELRAVVSSTVLRLQGHVASVASVSAARATPGMRSSPVALRSTSDTGILADYWRNYLSVLCVTMPELNGVPATPPVQRTKEAVILTPDTISSPALFHYLTALLGWEDPRFRDAGIYALGCISQKLMRPLSEVLVSATRRLADGMKVGNGNGNGVGNGTPRKTGTNGPLWTAIAHVFRLISPLILDIRSSSHQTNLSSLLIFVKLTYTLLSDPSVKEDYTLQTLRRSFCHVVENLTAVLAKLDSSDRFLGEEMRGGVFKLCAEWCFVGRRDGRESLMMKVLGNGGGGDRDKVGLMDDLGAKMKLLSAASAEAMAGLCQGKLISTEEPTPAQQASEHMVEPLTVLRWIRSMFTSSNAIHHETGRKALFALIKYNWSCKRLLDEVLHQSFGEGEQFGLESSFFGVVADILSEGLITLPIEQCACLALSKLGHPVSDIRQRAFQFTISLLDTGGEDDSATLLPAIGSTSPNVYRQAQREMAGRLANTHSEKAIGFLGECTIRLSQLEAPRRQATLTILPPWLNILDLATEEEQSAEHQALSNLMYLAIRFSDDHLDDIQSIFTAFADTPGGSPRNTTTLVKFLFEQGGRRKSTEFVTHAQRVISCLAGSEAGEVVFEEICRFVEPGAMAAVVEADEGVSPITSLANLDTLLPTGGGRGLTYSTGQLALLFAGELLPQRLGDIGLTSKLPTLLHVALAHCDHPSSELRESSHGVLFQVLRSWIYDTGSISPGNARSIWATAEGKITDLSRTRSTIFWSNDDVGDSASAFLAPPKMTNLIMKILGILLPLQPRIRQIWGELALSWATSCPIRHLACRSFQMFRVLSPKISARMISDTLARLSSTIASSSPEIQVFNREVLRTFAVVVQNLGASEVGGYPQLFWCTVACLSTPFEDEFTEVVELLSHLLDKTNLSDPKVVSNLLSFRPPDWVGAEPYLQQLLLPGLRSSKTSLMTFDLIRRLSSASNAELIDSEQGRLINGFITALPWMLQSIDLGEANEDLGMMALDLASISENAGRPGFTRLLTSFAHMRFRTKDDFVRQAASLLRESLGISGQARNVIVTLLGFVLNSEEWMRDKVLGFLPLVLQHPEARAVMGGNNGELLQPLLRLVSSKHASQVLDVLDMPISSSSDGGEVSEDAFGPISTTGWSIPRAKEASALTRENVTAVFNTCAIETRTASAHFSIVQFTDLRGMAQHSNIGQAMARGASGHSTRQMNHMPNHSELSLGSLPSPINGGGMGMDNASMGDLVGALHSLNQFFDDGLEESPKGVGLGGVKGHTRMGSESASERRIRAIMARGRNPSVTSPIYETSNFSPSTKRHRPTRSDLTDTSLLSDDQSQSHTNTQTYGNYRTHHATNMSMSSMTSVISDFDRSENLFGLDEDGQEVVGVIGFGASNLSLGEEVGGSMQGTPVKGRP